jgi:peptidoglycan/LPS O-acetylase OafA/YrhL
MGSQCGIKNQKNMEYKVEAIRLFLKSYLRIIMSLAAAGVFFFVVQHLILVVITASSRVIITAEIDHADVFQIYFSNSFSQPSFQEKDSFKSDPVPVNAKTDALIRLHNASVRTVRLDPGNTPGTVKIFKMKVLGHFAKPREMGPEELMRFFQPGKDDVQLSLEHDYLKVVSRQEDPSLLGAGPLVDINPWLPNGMAVVFTLLVFALLYRFDYASFPAFHDVLQKKPSIGSNIDALDGLRGLAAVIIVADHTYGMVVGIGAIGVWLFMTLSGFLIARPFVLQPERALSLPFWEKFFIRRVKRIVPLYYAYITVVFLIPGEFNDAFRHFFFLQGNGVLWVINQEMVFYLLTPFIMLANCLLFRGKIWPIVVNLTLLMFLSYYLVSPSVFAMYGMNHQALRLYVGIFLAGIIFSYLYYGVYEPSEFARKGKERHGRILSWLGLVILIGFMLGTTGRMWGVSMVWGIAYDQWFGIAAGLFIFCIVASRNTALDKLLALLPFRAIGLVSFSIYILHPLVMQIVRKGINLYYGLSLNDLPLFICTLTATYIASCITYVYIERPFTRS